MNLLSISDQKQAQHDLEDKQKAVEQELAFLIDNFKQAGHLNSDGFIKEAVQVFALAMTSLLRNKLNFDAEKRRQQNGTLTPADHSFLEKRLSQTLDKTQREWVTPRLKKLCIETGNDEQWSRCTVLLQQDLHDLRLGFPSWIEEKLES